MAIDKKRLSETSIFVLIAIGIGLAVGWWLPAKGVLELDVDRNFEDFTVLLTNLTIITLLVERGIEIAWSSQRGQQKQYIVRDLGLARSRSPVDEDDVKQLEDRLFDFRAQTEKFALRVGFIAGLALSMGGLRVLEVIFDTSHLTSRQDTLVLALDVLLTACLVAGGSKGMNKLTDRIQKVVARNDAMNPTGARVDSAKGKTTPKDSP